MARHAKRREVVYVERAGDTSVKWLFWGGVLGAAVALLYAPRSGEETRRQLQRKLWKLRAITEEKLDEIAQQFGGRDAFGPLTAREDEEEDDDEGPGAAGDGFATRGAASPREEMERRLAEARARRRGRTESGEPLA